MSWVSAGFAAVPIKTTAAQNEIEESQETVHIQGYGRVRGKNN